MKKNILDILYSEEYSENTIKTAETHLELLTNLQENGELDENYILELNNSCLFNLVGLCYFHDRIYDLAKKYFLMAIDVDSQNKDAVFNLAGYYLAIDNNYDLAIKYLKMSCDLGCRAAMYYLGLVYMENKDHKNNDMAKKYLMMAFDNGYYAAAVGLGQLYENIKDFENSRKYYLIACDNCVDDALNQFVGMHKNLCVYDKQFTEDLVKYIGKTNKVCYSENDQELAINLCYAYCVNNRDDVRLYVIFMTNILPKLENYLMATHYIKIVTIIEHYCYLLETRFST